MQSKHTLIRCIRRKFSSHGEYSDSVPDYGGSCLNDFGQGGGRPHLGRPVGRCEQGAHQQDNRKE
jgi:hypothetical protein